MRAHSFHIVLGYLLKTFQTLKNFTKFSSKEIRWNFAILHILLEMEKKVSINKKLESKTKKLSQKTKKQEKWTAKDKKFKNSKLIMNNILSIVFEIEKTVIFWNADINNDFNWGTQFLVSVEVYFFFTLFLYFCSRVWYRIGFSAVFLGSCDDVFFSGNRLWHFVLKSIIGCFWVTGHRQLCSK